MPHLYPRRYNLRLASHLEGVEVSFIEELAAVTAAVAARAQGAVVRIGRREGRGTGIVVAPNTVLTSAHNLRGEEVTVTFADGRSAAATVKGVDSDGDLAVVTVDTASVTPLAWAPGDGSLAIGAPVFALALPAGSGGVRVTFGTVSAIGRAFRGPRGRLIADAVEHTAPLGRGSSGGPLVDAEGRLLAINTHRPGDGLYLARPASQSVRETVEALARGEAPVRRRLGVALTPPHVARRLRSAVGLPARDGVLVRAVEENGPGAAAGLQRGDLIVSAGGEDVASFDALLAAVDRVEAGGVLPVRVLRGTDEVMLEVRFDQS
jgi:serine protease Do